MPSDRFYKLDDDKRSRIIDASIDELADKGYEESSINQIIKDANISRGSFYTYFIDKDDLFEFIIKKIRNEAFDSIIKAIELNDGDVFTAATDLMQTAVTTMKKKEKMMKLYNKLFESFGIMDKFNACLIGADTKEIAYQLEEFYIRLKRASQNYLKDISDDQIVALFDMMATSSIKVIIQIKKDPKNEKSYLRLLADQYGIMKRGLGL